MAAGDLLARLIQEEGEEAISNHQFSAAFVQWKHISSSPDIVRTDIISAFNIQTNEEEDLDWLATQYDGATDTEKFINNVHYCLMLAEDSLLGLNVKSALKTAIQAGKT